MALDWNNADRELARTQKASFHMWREPDVMLDRVGQLMDEWGSVSLFGKPQLKFLTEAWAASKFAGLRGAERVRLNEPWPDFEIGLNGAVQQFELTEADLKSRRRGREYADRHEEGRATTDDGGIEDWIANADEIPIALNRVAAKKTGKRYGSKQNLLIFLNIVEYGVRHRESIAKFPVATSVAKEAFREIWVLWKDETHLVWGQGDQLPLLAGAYLS